MKIPIRRLERAARHSSPRAEPTRPHTRLLSWACLGSASHGPVLLQVQAHDMTSGNEQLHPGGAVSPGEHDALPLGRLERWMQDHVDGFRGPLAAQRFEGGQSNPTYKLLAGSGTHVLRPSPLAICYIWPGSASLRTTSPKSSDARRRRCASAVVVTSTAASPRPTPWSPAICLPPPRTATSGRRSFG
jgi:hypothetical protein